MCETCVSHVFLMYRLPLQASIYFLYNLHKLMWKAGVLEECIDMFLVKLSLALSFVKRMNDHSELL